MSARPILFNADMIRALLAGTKRQTRRPINPQPEWVYPEQERGGGRAVAQVGARIGLAFRLCPHGQPGDLLWVREAYCLEHEIEGNHPPHQDGRPTQHNAAAFDGQPRWVQPHYRATDPEPELAYEYGTCPRCQDGEPHAHWKPSIHMPRWGSRLTLRITDVRVQRVQDITANDATAEGGRIPVNAATGNPMLDIGSPYAACHYLTPEQAQRFDHGAWMRAHFASAWDQLYAKRGNPWADNPWVWAISVEVLRGNVDHLEHPA